MKIKRFSGYSEAAPEGVTYQKSSQVITRYILDPLDSSVDTLEETDKLGVTKRKSDRIKKVIKPLKKYFKYKSNKNSNSAPPSVKASITAWDGPSPTFLPVTCPFSMSEMELMVSSPGFMS